MGAAEEIWYGNGLTSQVARGALTPASWLYEMVVRGQSQRFERDKSAVQTPALPALSIGNITVGGTGKTPIAAWCAAELLNKGAKPAIVMRGYGGDEPLVHQKLNPGVDVIADADRIAGAAKAKAMGADCVILDDAFQHRRIARVSDWVLVAAEQWRDNLRTLPGGPLREPVAALSRADLVVITRKSAEWEEAARVARAIADRFPALGLAHCHFTLAEAVDFRTGRRFPVSWLSGRVFAAAAAVGWPSGFFAQLRSIGAELHEFPYRDHHAFSASDVARLVMAAERTEGLVCTLKDAVKLGPQWPPAAAPLWYVSQNAVIEAGYEVLDRALEGVLAARHAPSSPAG